MPLFQKYGLFILYAIGRPSPFPAQINGQIAGPGGKFAQKARIGPVVRTQIPLSAQKLIKGHLHVRTMLGKKESRPKVPEAHAFAFGFGLGCNGSETGGRRAVGQAYGPPMILKKWVLGPSGTCRYQYGAFRPEKIVMFGELHAGLSLTHAPCKLVAPMNFRYVRFLYSHFPPKYRFFGKYCKNWRHCFKSMAYLYSTRSGDRARCHQIEIRFFEFPCPD